MKKLFYICMSLLALTACTNDDQYELSDFVGTETINVTYNGNYASVGILPDYVTATVVGADVVINSYTSKNLVIYVSGTTTDGSLLFYGKNDWGLVLQNANICNLDGPAINNQCHKALFITCPEGTVNTLSDGTSYAEASFDQKGAIFSEGELYLQGKGTLNVTGNTKNALASDDYITIYNGITLNLTANGSNGMKANDGVFINGGMLNITVNSDGGRGIRSESVMDIIGGIITINTSGDCKIETIDGVRDTTSCAGIKSDSLFTMSGGTLNITSTGDGGKGIYCLQDIRLTGGTMNITTKGSNDDGKPKAVKSATGIILSGGSFTAQCKKSWACDNGTDSENPADRVTIIGTPTTKEIEKRYVSVIFPSVVY